MNRNTPIHKAAENGHIPAISVLLENGAIINSRNMEG
jgi:ankyrin repeat protein